MLSCQCYVILTTFLVHITGYLKPKSAIPYLSFGITHTHSMWITESTLAFHISMGLKTYNTYHYCIMCCAVKHLNLHCNKTLIFAAFLNKQLLDSKDETQTLPAIYTICKTVRKLNECTYYLPHLNCCTRLAFWLVIFDSFSNLLLFILLNNLQHQMIKFLGEGYSWLLLPIIVNISPTFKITTMVSINNHNVNSKCDCTHSSKCRKPSKNPTEAKNEYFSSNLITNYWDNVLIFFMGSLTPCSPL